MAPSPQKPRTGNLPEWAKSRPAAQAARPAGWSLTVDPFMAGIGAGAVALLLAVSFGLGFQVAKKITTRRLDEKYKAQITDITRNMIAAQPAATATTDTATGDPRIPNLNYLRLCQVPAADGEKLAQFLATQGHRSLRLPVAKAPHLVTLYAINQAFGSGQREKMERFRAELRLLGDKWAKSNKGGNPFRSMMLEKYTP